MADAAPEADVLAAWASGELPPEEAFARLYQSYAGVVRAWLAVRAGNAADDLFQDVWTIFYRRCREWEHRQDGAAPDARPVLSFLFRTCELVLRAHRRIHAQRGMAPLEAAADPAVDGHRHAIETIQLGECLEAARRHCTDQECAVLSAKLAGLAGREIARALHLTESAVDHRFRNAVARIREALTMPPQKDAHV